MRLKYKKINYTYSKIHKVSQFARTGVCGGMLYDLQKNKCFHSAFKGLGIAGLAYVVGECSMLWGCNAEGANIDRGKHSFRFDSDLRTGSSIQYENWL